MHLVHAFHEAHETFKNPEPVWPPVHMCVLAATSVSLLAIAEACFQDGRIGLKLHFADLAAKRLEEKKFGPEATPTLSRFMFAWVSV